MWTELTPTKLGAIIALLRSSSPLGTETIQRLFFFTAVFGQIQANRLHSKLRLHDPAAVCGHGSTIFIMWVMYMGLRERVPIGEGTTSLPQNGSSSPPKNAKPHGKL